MNTCPHSLRLGFLKGHVLQGGIFLTFSQLHFPADIKVHGAFAASEGPVVESYQSWKGQKCSVCNSYDPEVDLKGLNKVINKGGHSKQGKLEK